MPKIEADASVPLGRPAIKTADINVLSEACSLVDELALCVRLHLISNAGPFREQR